MRKYIVEFKGEILVKARDDIDAEETLHELSGDELLRGITQTVVTEATQYELREHLGNVYQARDYL